MSTGRGRQLLFDLGAGEARAEEDFVVGPSNVRAHGYLSAWPDWPYHAAVLAGPAGAGKSHLASLWAARAGAVLLEATVLEIARLAGGEATAVLVEDADRGGLDETGLFHLINLMAERAGHVLITARRPPGAWGLSLQDLASRLRGAPLIEIATPDETLLEAIMVKLFADRQLEVEPDVVAYALSRVERSPAAVRRLVETVDLRSLEEQRRVGVRLVKEVLADWDATGRLF